MSFFKIFLIPHGAAERKKNRKQLIMWTNQKRIHLHGTYKFHYEKKNIIRRDLTLNSHTPNFSLTESSSSQKLSLYEDPPEPLKRPLSAVQKPLCSFSQHRMLSLFMGFSIFWLSYDLMKNETPHYLN